MSDPGRVYQTFGYPLYTIAKESEELEQGQGRICLHCNRGENHANNGYSRNYRQKPNNKLNVFWEKIVALCTELKRTKKKSEGFGVKRLTDKWRGQTYYLYRVLCISRYNSP